MFCDHNPGLQSQNFIDGLVFTRHDPCIWVVYPPGAAGDLLISIIDRHYLRTGCEYYGINDRGRVMLYTTDYKMVNTALLNDQPIVFDDQWFYDFSDQLSSRHLTYSMLDQVIFGCHLYRPQDIQKIIGNFSEAKIINIFAQDDFGDFLRSLMKVSKCEMKDLPNALLDSYQAKPYMPEIVVHERVLNIPFGFQFDRQSYDRYYKIIREFLNLNGALICFDFIEFYLSKQHPVVAAKLQEYSRSL